MSRTLQISRQIPIRDTVDVLVAGGGPAGVAAAVTAARQGCRVVLIDGQNCLGGQGTAGFMPCFMAFGDEVHFYAEGVGREVYERMLACGGFWPNQHWGPFIQQIRHEVLKRVYDDLVVSAGIRLNLVTQVIGVEAEAGQVSHVLCAAKSGIFAYAAHTIIDCTGDGDLAAWAGAPFEMGDARGQVMPGTLCTLWTDIDWAAVAAARQDRVEVLHEVLHLHPEMFTTPDPHLVGILPIGPHQGGGNVGHIFNLNGLDEESLTRGVVEARRATLPEFEQFYRRYMTGFEEASIIASAPLIGVRETRRILGDYVLNTVDYDARASFDDEIGRYHYWVDRHPEEPTMDLFNEHLKRERPNAHQHPCAHYQPGESYGIPYRILTPRGLDNLLVAGRCVSTDRNVQASIRVMPGCFITGQAAGMAAAMAVAADRSTHAVDVPQLQQRLRKMGAFLPNAVTAEA